MSRRTLASPRPGSVAPDREEAPRLAYRVDEVAASLGVSRRTVENMINDGRLRSIKTHGLRLVEAASVKALFSPPAAPRT